MCGRFVLIGDWGKIAQEFDLSETESTLSATGDIYPGQDSACIIRTETGNSVVNLHWGFVPKWATPKLKTKLLINARAETLGEKPAFSDAFQKRRCLIVAFGFYEWTEGKKPFYFYLRSGQPFGLAGIYEAAITPGGPKSSFVIITTGPNKLIASLHDRMPVIIPVDKRFLWLDYSQYDKDRLKSLLVPYPEAEMEMRQAEFTARRR
jgi:putative SOS response-associated peptidase YedK